MNRWYWGAEKLTLALVGLFDFSNLSFATACERVPELRCSLGTRSGTCLSSKKHLRTELSFPSRNHHPGQQSPWSCLLCWAWMKLRMNTIICHRWNIVNSYWIAWMPSYLSPLFSPWKKKPWTPPSLHSHESSSFTFVVQIQEKLRLFCFQHSPNPWQKFDLRNPWLSKFPVTLSLCSPEA